MFAIAARRMGYRVHTFSPEGDTPTGQVADVEITAPYGDLEAVASFARSVDVVTFEFENVPGETARAAEAIVPVRPSPEVLHTVQNRIREKTFLSSIGVPVPSFRPVRTEEDLVRAVSEIGVPAILKTAQSGYDGKGQRRISSGAGASEAWRSLLQEEAILEEFVDFEKEISVVVSRSAAGAVVGFGAIENDHRNHILDVSVAPAGIPAELDIRAQEIAAEVVAALDLVGVLCVEFFLTRDARLLVNELAPRPHNSGHLTLDACVTNQFEQQLRAVCGLPLGSAQYLRPAAMANLLGDLWDAGEPDWNAVCSLPDVKLHLYGKTSARPGRKMGHLTVLAADARSARDRVKFARRLLRPSEARDSVRLDP
jgi:5-(carboxyamino)imidazole ribonucleotide synthase